MGTCQISDCLLKHLAIFIIRIGGILTLSISLICPDDVWGVKTICPYWGCGGESTKKVSHSSLAACSLGMFNASNAYQSHSTSGYLTRTNPNFSKVLEISAIA